MSWSFVPNGMTPQERRDFASVTLVVAGGLALFILTSLFSFAEYVAKERWYSAVLAGVGITVQVLLLHELMKIYRRHRRP